MKNIALVGTLILLTGCVNSQTNEITMAEEQTTEVVENVVVASPCTPCQSARVEQPVLKPRVTEVYTPPIKRACCPQDAPQSAEEPKVIIPSLPEIYIVSANRVANSMLAGATAVFENGPAKMYVENTEIAAQDLPKGAQHGVNALKKRLANASTVLLKDNKSDAEYIVKTKADWFDTPTKNVPAVKYTLSLESKDGISVGEWTEVVHQADGDRSWW